MALIPASILIVYLIGVLMYLLTRCCDRKSRRDRSNGCQKCTLFFFAILCAIAVGAGKKEESDACDAIGIIINIHLWHFSRSQVSTETTSCTRASRTCLDRGGKSNGWSRMFGIR